MAESTDVRIVISAVTEAAEKAIDEVGDELTGIADDAAIGQTALDQLSDELSETAGAAEVTQVALDELQDDERDATVATQLLKSAQEDLGDELEENTAKAGAAAGAFSALSLSSAGASINFGILSTATTLSLIPALLTLATILAPLVVVLGALAAGAAALAGAFGLIIGTGILAFGQQRAQQNKERLNQVNSQVEALERLKQSEAGLTAVQQDRLDRLKEEQTELKDATTATGALGQVMGELKEEITPLLVDFGEAFIPLIKDAVDAIPTLVENMLDAVGGTEEFRDALGDFGAIAMDALPALVGLMFDLARIALPVLRDLVTFLQNNGNGALREMEEAVGELEPELSDLLDALIEAGPVVLEFGTNVAEVVIPVLADAVRLVTAFMDAINRLPEPLQNAAIGFLVALPLIAKFSGLLGALIPSAYSLGVAFGLLEAAVAAVTGTLAGIAAVGVAVGTALGLIGVKLLDMLGFFGAVGDAGQAFGKLLGDDLTDAFLTLISVISLGIIPLLAGLGGVILGLVRGDLDAAVDNFNEIMGKFGGAIKRTLTGIITFIGKWAISFSIAVTKAFLDVVVMASVWGTQLIVDFANAIIGFDWVSWSTNLIEDLGEGIANLIDAAYDWGVQMGQAIADGIASAPGNIIEGAGEAAAGVVDGTAGFVGNNTPDVPGLQVGGLVEETGLVNLHAGEYVVPADGGLEDSAAAVDSGADPSQSDGRGQEPVMQKTRQTVVQGGLNVNVDAGEFGRNPRQDSRTFADQLRRELRNQNGSTS